MGLTDGHVWNLVTGNRGQRVTKEDHMLERAEQESLRRLMGEGLRSNTLCSAGTFSFTEVLVHTGEKTLVPIALQTMARTPQSL